MESLNEHRRYLGRRYELACDADALTAREVSLLERYGLWLEALATGMIEPITNAQKSFVMVHQCKATPRTEFELTWFKYQVQRIFEFARRLETDLSTPGKVQYWQVHEAYRKAAFLGHAGAISWIEREGDAGPAPSPIDGLDLSVPDVRLSEPMVIADTGCSRASPPAQSFSERDWSTSFDDLDSEAWEKHLSGPDDSSFES